MLKTSKSRARRRVSWPVPGGHQERAVGAPRERPERAGRRRIAFHRHQDHVGRHAVGILAERALEQLEPAVAVDRLADGRRRGALRRQAVGDDEDVVGRRDSARSSAVNAFSRLVPSAGTVRRRFTTTSVSACASLPSSQRPVLSGTSGHAFVLNASTWNFDFGGNLRRQPVDRGDGAPPFLRHQPARLRHVAQPDHVDDRFVQHARRDVDEDDDPLAAELEAAQVLTIAGADEPLHAVARLAGLRRAGGEPPLALHRSTSGRPSASRSPRGVEIVVLSASASCSLVFAVSCSTRSDRPSARCGLGRRRLQAVAQHDEVGITLQHLFLELVHFGAQFGRSRS